MSSTGSTASGSKILHNAADTNKAIHLELGGKSPLIIMPDCDLDKAATDAAGAIFWHCGQVCTAASRLLVHQDIYDDFMEKFVESSKQMQPDLPDSGAALGSMVSEQHRDSVISQIDDAQARGANIVLDGREFAKKNNAFLGPTIVTEVDNSDPICQQELFGPVVAVLKVRSLPHAIELANDSIYGLAAGIWTNNINSAMKAARQIRTGSFWINGYGSDRLEMPWGGCKQSGFGRELGKQAFELFTHVKSVHLRHD